MVRTDENNTQYKGVQCHECEGYGHIRTECATFLKTQKKSLVVSWLDEDDYDDEVENESGKHASAFAGMVMSDTESYEEELNYEVLAISHHELIARNVDLDQMLEKQGEIIRQLQFERSENLIKISKLNDEVAQLNFQLEQVKKQVRMMTIESNVLDDMLEVKDTMKPKGTGLDYRAHNKKQRNINSAYPLQDCGMVRQPQLDQISTSNTRSNDLADIKPMLEHSREHRRSRTKKKSNSWICHH